MPRCRERDYPGAWWHVINRGIAKRSAFGNDTTSRYAWDGYRRVTQIDHEDSASTEFASYDYGWDKQNDTGRRMSPKAETRAVYARRSDGLPARRRADRREAGDRRRSGSAIPLYEERSHASGSGDVYTSSALSRFAAGATAATG